MVLLNLTMLFFTYFGNNTNNQNSNAVHDLASLTVESCNCKNSISSFFLTAPYLIDLSLCSGEGCVKF
jgi:hypothetical protein